MWTSKWNLVLHVVSSASGFSRKWNKIKYFAVCIYANSVEMQRSSHILAWWWALFFHSLSHGEKNSKRRYCIENRFMNFSVWTMFGCWLFFFALCCYNISHYFALWYFNFEHTIKDRRHVELKCYVSCAQKWLWTGALVYVNSWRTLKWYGVVLCHFGVSYGISIHRWCLIRFQYRTLLCKIAE